MNFLRFAAASSVLAIVAYVHDAAACGGCFHPTAETGSSVITDHRMAFKISTEETILWDQVRYSGDPTEFAWVLPVRAGAKVELSRDEWMYALDTSTKAVVAGPDVTCSNGRVSSIQPGSAGGGGCGGGSSTQSFSDSTPSSGSEDAGSLRGNEDVQVISDTVIGPYQAVTIRSSDGKGIGAWLTENGFAIPPQVVPVVDAYTAENFDFIALRLRPGQGVRAMQPVRVVTPGADVSLPLRMVAAGVGSHVGLTLFVVGEGRYHTDNFPDSIVDWNSLAWDGRQNRSNMTDLVATALASNDGRGWITEAAIHAGGSSTVAFADPLLSVAYTNTCQYRPERTVPCDETALPPSNGSPDDAGADAGDDGGDGGSDAGDAGTKPPPACTKTVSGCDGFDDFEVATRGLHAGDIWVTRLRADLPVAALSADLRLSAAAQTEERPERSTVKFTDANFNPCAASGGSPSSSSSSSGGSSSGGGCVCRTTRFPIDSGTWLLIGATALGAAMILRAKKRR
jgi:hypothetical protein